VVAPETVRYSAAYAKVVDDETDGAAIRAVAVVAGSEQIAVAA
jgi:hypothetical protein